MKNINLYILISIILVSCGKKPLYTADDISQKHVQRAREHFTAGMFFELDNKHENALIEFYQALLYDSSSATIYNRIAENHMSLGRFESALRYLVKSKKIDPDRVETYRLMADSYYRLKKDKEAVAYLNKVLEMDPLDENSRSMLLLLYRKNSDYLGIAGQYQKMIQIYGEDEDWVKKAAAIYIKNGQIDEALMLFESYVKTDSSNASMWYSVGTAYELKNQPDPAINAYAKALQLAPEVIKAGERIFHLCRQERKWQTLIDLFSPVHNEVSQPFYTISLAEAYLMEKDYEESEKLLLPLLDETPVSYEVYELLGRIEWDKKNYEQAKSYFQQIIDQDNRNRIGWLFKGFVLSDTDSLEQAEKHYRKALEYLGEDPFILSFHGISLQRLDRDTDALVPLEKSLSIDPDNTNTRISYAISLNRLSRNNAAIEQYETVLTLDPENLSALTSLGMIFDEMKLYAKCDSIYEYALRLHPDNDLLMNNYSYSLAERNIRLDYALEMAQKAVNAQPENGAYLDTIGWIYYQLQNYDMALLYIKKSVEARENSAVVIEHLGDVYLKLGDLSEAQKQWEKALELDNENERLKQKIENAQHEM